MMELKQSCCVGRKAGRGVTADGRVVVVVIVMVVDDGMSFQDEKAVGCCTKYTSGRLLCANKLSLWQVK